MVLKRFLTAALGALGLGALTSGTALADGIGVPAPDLFNDQLACSGNLPAAMDRYTPATLAMGADSTDLADAIDAVTSDNAFPSAGSGDAMNPNIFDKLTYMIPTANCGGTTAIVEANALAVDVAAGYAIAMNKYDAVYGTGGTDARLKAAQKTLDDHLKTTNPSASLTKSYTEARDKAREADTKARNELNSAGAGPVYQAAISEWMAKDAVVGSVTKFNEAFTKHDGAKDDLNALTFQTPTVAANGTVTFSGEYIDLTNNHVGELGGGDLTNVLTAVDDDNDGETDRYEINVTNLRTWVGADGINTGDNFDDKGNLLVPDQDDPDSTDPLDRIPVKVSKTILLIRADKDDVDLVVETLEDFKEDNTNAALVPLIDEGLRRAKLEQAHFQAEWDRAVAHTEDQRTTANRNANNTVCTADQGLGDDCYLSTPVTIAGVYADEAEALSGLNAATDDLTDLAKKRETATGNVVTEFETPASFYQQAVDRRQYLKDVADDNLSNAGTNASNALKNRAELAAKALTAASKAQSDYKALVSDTSNPANALIDELVKGEGDDGGAVVDAVTANHNSTLANADRLDALLATDADGAESGRIANIEESISGLTGDSGKVGENSAAIAALTADTTDGATADGPVTANKKNIATNADSIAALTADTGPVTANAKGIQTNTDSIAALTADTGPVTANAKGIQTNTDSIAALTADTGPVTANAKGIQTNTESINRLNTDIYGETASAHDGLAACDSTALIKRVECNAATAAHNGEDIGDINDYLKGKLAEELEEIGGDIGKNLKAIGENLKAIGDNKTAIGKNATAIGDNLKAIGDNKTAIGGNATAIGENLKAIGDNKTAIGENATAIGDNKTAIGENATAIGENATAIGENATAIGENATAIGDNKTAIGENATAIGQNQTAIMTNAGNIVSNAENIAGNTAAIMTEMEDRMAGDAANAAGIATNAGHISDNMAAIGSNASAIASNMNSIGANASAIGRNASMIGELSEDLDVVRAGVAASMALAGMPAINGRGISIGVGSYDGESAFAVGFQIQGEQASFKVGVTSSGGETGASAGVGFNF